jgi:hypothetical protein
VAPEANVNSERRGDTSIVQVHPQGACVRTTNNSTWTGREAD